MNRKISLLITIVALLFLTSACSRNVVPPGTVVIVAKTSGANEIHTKGVYTAWGKDRVYFVDSKLKSFTESLQILCKDKVNMKVDVKWVGSFKTTKQDIEMIKAKVPSKAVKNGDIDGFMLDLGGFYKTAMKDILRSNTRNVVSPYTTDTIADDRKVIEADIRKLVIERYKALGYPIQTTDVLVSNLDYDPVITAQRQAIKKAQLDDQKKAAEAKATIAQAIRQEDIARAQGKALIESKKAEAAGNQILAKSITAEILAMRQWEVLEKMAAGPNNELIVLPYNAINADTLQTTMNRQSLRGSRK